jgi:hypothetical protein
MDRNLKLSWLALACVAVSSLCMADGLIDPTRPANVRTSASSGALTPQRIRVEAIFNRGTQRVAIVNGKVVKAGDELAGGRVDEVTADGIRYSMHNGRGQFARLDSQSVPVRRIPIHSGNPPSSENKR